MFVLEFLNNNNEWTFFAVYECEKAEQALENYTQEMGLTLEEGQEIQYSNDGACVYVDIIDARAFPVDVIKL